MAIPLLNSPIEKHAPVSTVDQVYLAQELVDRHDLKAPAGFFDAKGNVDTIIRSLAFHPDAAFPERTGFAIENHLRKLYFTCDDAAWITQKLNDFVDDKKYELEKSHIELLIMLFNSSDHPLEVEQMIDPENEQFDREDRALEEASF